MGEGGNTAIGGANMWALLLDKDPGHSAVAGDLAADVVDRKLKTSAPVAVKVDEAPPADNVAKPVKRVNKAKVNTKSTAGCTSKEALAAAAAIVEDCVPEQMYGDVVETSWTVAERARKATAAGSSTGVTGADMWALLGDEDPGQQGTSTVFDLFIDPKLQKPVVVEVAQPAKCGQSKMASKEKEGAAGAGERKQVVALAATAESSGKVPINGAGDSKQTAVEVEEAKAALPSNEWVEVEEAKEEMFNVVAARGGRRRPAAARTSKVAVVAEDTVIAGTNMWALLNDDDPGHGAAKQAKKKTKTKKKKDAAGASKQVGSVDDNKVNETATAVELEEDTAPSEAEEEMTGCRTVASLVCGAAVAVGMFVLCFQLVHTAV